MSKYANYEIKTFLILRNSKGDLLMTQNDHADSIIFGYINPPRWPFGSGRDRY